MTEHLRVTIEPGHGWFRLIERVLGHSNHGPTALAFELPTVTVRGIPMANFQLKNDAVVTISIKEIDQTSGAALPIPAGDTFSVSNDNPTALNAVIGTDAAGNPALVLNALMQAASGVNVSVSDSAGAKAASLVVDIVADVVPDLVLDTADAVSVPQAVPAA